MQYYRPVKQALAYLGVEAAFTCGHRLYTLFCRSCPDIKFIPSRGLLNILKINDFSLFNKLPGADLCGCLSNDAYEAIQEHDLLIMNYTAIHETFAVNRKAWEERLSFSKKPYLKPEPGLVRQWHDRLRPFRQRNKPLVGITWRSSFQLWFRNQYYLSAQEISELLKTDEAVFINLQIGNISRELLYLESHLPHTLIHFSDLDQFNDFENTAAMFECLDFIISPRTTPALLAAGLGVPVIEFCPTHIDKYLVKPGTQDDIHHPSTTHIFPDTPNDRNSLQQNLMRAMLAKARSDSWKERRVAIEKKYSLTGPA